MAHEMNDYPLVIPVGSRILHVGSCSFIFDPASTMTERDTRAILHLVSSQDDQVNRVSSHQVPNLRPCCKGRMKANVVPNTKASVSDDHDRNLWVYPGLGRGQISVLLSLLVLRMKVQDR